MKKWLVTLLLVSFVLGLTTAAFAAVAAPSDKIRPIGSVQVSPLPVRYLKVTDPAAGETWDPGATHLIKWNYMGNIGDIRILLWKGNQQKSIIAIIPQGQNGKGQFHWSIPANIETGSDYQIRLDSVQYADTKTAGETFTIHALNYLTVMSPNGGEGWLTKENHMIKFSVAGNCGSSVKIELLRNYAVTETIAASFPINGPGIYSLNWYTPHMENSGLYRIRITSTTNTSIHDVSNNNFTITQKVF